VRAGGLAAAAADETAAATTEETAAATTNSRNAVSHGRKVPPKARTHNELTLNDSNRFGVLKT
jgi:hypothetical protein